MIGFSLKFWTMSLEDGETEFGFKNLNSFIFQDETFATLVAVTDLIRSIAADNADIENCVTAMLSAFNSPASVKDGLEVGEEAALVKSELRVTEHVVKLEPELPLFEGFFSQDQDKLQDLTDSNKQGQTQSPPVYTCECCYKEFRWIKSFVTHLNDCNPCQVESTMEGLKPNAKRKLQKLLSMTADEIEEAKKTKKEKVKYPKGPFYCEKCPQIFQKYPGFVSHCNAHDLSVKSSKLDPSSAGAAPKIEWEYQLVDLRDGVVMKCDKCDLAYSAFQSFKNHMDQFHKKALACEHCGMKFTLRNTLVKHKIDYHTLFPKKCDQCANLVLTAKQFFEHLQAHGKNYIGKTAPCEICGKMLKNKYVLKAHVEAVHEKKTKSGQFSCDECGKILGTKASLEYHRKSTHTQEFPYRCEVCGKGFLKYNRMMTCTNNHHGIYKYRCTECEYKTNKLLQFKEHMNSHTREIIFYCPVCNQQSNGTKNLGCHTKQVHKLTLCQAEVLHKRSRLGAPMTEEQIEEMKHKMTSLKPYHMPMPVKKFENGIPVENK